MSTPFCKDYVVAATRAVDQEKKRIRESRRFVIKKKLPQKLQQPGHLFFDLQKKKTIKN